MKPQWTWFAMGVVAAAVLFLLTGQGAGTVLPVLLLLACPVAMVFMMRGMGGTGSRPEESSPQESGTRPGPPADHEGEERP